MYWWIWDITLEICVGLLTMRYIVSKKNVLICSIVISRYGALNLQHLLAKSRFFQVCLERKDLDHYLFMFFLFYQQLSTKDERTWSLHSHPNSLEVSVDQTSLKFDHELRNMRSDSHMCWHTYKFVFKRIEESFFDFDLNKSRYF